MVPVIEMRKISKVFPGVVANDQINFTVAQGEIHALLGENGAGKSTLMNILYGLYPPSSGEIYIKGQQVTISSPNVAIGLGIGMVHQHFMLIPALTVAENIVLGKEPRRFGFLDKHKAVKRVQEISLRYGLKVNPQAKVVNTSVGMQQRIEILKALYRRAEILILDEPTAVLTPQEITELFAIMQSLVTEGKSVIFISHKLKEIMAIANKVTIIRSGKVVDTVKTVNTTPNELAAKMVGRAVSFQVRKKQFAPGQPVLQLDRLEAQDNRNLPALKEVSLEVHRGEILGIAGVDGNGQSELIEVITGLRKATGGSVRIYGKDITNLQPRRIIASGVSHIPEDRQLRGLVLDFTVEENMVLETYYHSEFSKGFILNHKQIERYARRLIKEFDVRPSDEKTMARALSGGNQQKAIVARQLDKDSDLLIAAQPTRGIDVGAIEFVHKRLVEQRDKGKAVLLVSLDLDEILALSDRVAVIYEGNIVDVIDALDATEELLGLLMSGSRVHPQGGV